MDAMDPDLETVADAVALDGPASAALVRLVAKTGNVALMAQLLERGAEEVRRLRLRVSRLEGVRAPDDDGDDDGDDDDDELEHELALEMTRELERTMAEEDGSDDGRGSYGGGGGGGSGGGGGGGSGSGGEDAEALEAAAGKRGRDPEEEMIRYLDRPTKVQKTFDRFYRLYGDGEVSRKALGEFIRDQPDLLHKSSANKLFHPPKGFRVGLFVRKGSFVRLAKEWIDAWEGKRNAARAGVS